MAVDLSDLAVSTHVVGELGERADSLSADDAIGAYRALMQHLTSVRAALGHLEDQLKLVLEQPRRVGDVTYEVVPNYRWKRRERAVESQIITAAGDDVVKAVELAFALMCAPSDMPKKTVLAKLGLSYRDVADRVDNGRRLLVTDRTEDDA